MEIFYDIFFCYTMIHIVGISHKADFGLPQKTKNYKLSQFVHMLQTLHVSSNSEVLIMFPGRINSVMVKKTRVGQNPGRSKPG